MANTLVYLGEIGTGKIYRVGKVGFDSGATASYDPNSTAFTGTLKTERMSPAGENALVRFRRVALRVLQSGGWTVKFTIWVDDKQTQTYDNDTAGSPKVDQTITISNPSTDTGALKEALIEADIDAVGTYIQVQIELVSSDITGVFMPESIETQVQVMRETVSRATAESA